MFDKINLKKFYVANYVKETIEYIYGGINNSISIVHHFNKVKEKEIFIAITDSNEKFIGYMSLADGQLYNPLNNSVEDYEILFDNNAQNIEEYEKTYSGYINFEPLGNYNSRFIKNHMTLKLASKAINDINKQILEQKECDKMLVLKN